MTAGHRRYDDVRIGEAVPPERLVFAVEEETVARFLAATGAAPLPPEGGRPRQAPSMIAAVYLIELLRARRTPPGSIHARQTIRFHRAVHVGETLSIQGSILDKYTRKERPYIVLGFEARDRDGALVSSGTVTSIWGREDG